MILKRRLGKTGLDICPIGLGTWPISGSGYGRTDDNESIKVVQQAIDRGVNFIDTADVYGNGHCECLIGKAIEGKRDQVYLASKVGWDFYHGLIHANYDCSYIRFAIEESLKRLSTDHIDLYQLHNPPLDLIHDDCVIELLDALRREGKIRFWGVSIHEPEEGLRWVEDSRVQTLQVACNMMDQRSVERLFPIAKANNIGLIDREPLACGILSGKYGEKHRFSKKDHRNRWPREKLKNDIIKVSMLKDILSVGTVPLAQLAIEFCLHFDAVSVVIPGAKTCDQLITNMAALTRTYIDCSLHERIQNCYKEKAIFHSGFYRN
ncbi:MAG: aldo/keto reductase [Chlamydiota bacterium]|nr:aldo/keto reductase [Chlamydiota bacterium]